MAVAFRAISTGTGTDSTGEGTIPSGTAAGDLMIAFVTHSASTTTITGEPSGWTLQEADPAPADFSTWCYSRLWQSGDGDPTWTFSAAGNWTVDIVSYSGVDTTTPVNVDIGEQAAGVNAIALGAITPNVADCMLVGYAAVDATGGARTWTQDGSPTERLDQLNNQIHRCVAEELLSGGSGVGQTRTYTFTGSTQDVAGFLLALAPAAGATEKTLADSGSGADALQIAVAATLTDPGTGADTPSIAANVPLGEAASATDAIQVSIPRDLTDSGAGAAALTATAAVSFAEAGAAADTVSVVAAVTLIDSGTGTESILVGIPKTLTDAGAAGDAVMVTVAVSLAEMGAATETLVADQTRNLSDSGTTTDTILVEQIRTLADAGTGGDILRVIAALDLSDLGAAAENAAAAALAALADAGAGTNIFMVATVVPVFWAVGVATTQPAATGTATIQPQTTGEATLQLAAVGEAQQQ